LLVGVLALPTPIATLLRGFVGVRVEIAEAAFHRPSRARLAASSNALAMPSCALEWLKLLVVDHVVPVNQRMGNSQVPS
jgi:hypothetical protein